MAGRLRFLFDKFRRGLGDAARACVRLLLQTHAARLALVASQLWRAMPLPALLVAAVLLICGHSGWSTGRGVWAVLSPGSASGIGAAVVAVLAGLAVLELTAALAVTAMTAALQLAYDTGRHRVCALLVLASALALACLAWEIVGASPARLGGILLPSVLTMGLVALTIWFERAYRRPAYPGFRDFWSDIVSARRFLKRAAHGE